jgi:hypothetical protein
LTGRDYTAKVSEDLMSGCSEQSASLLGHRAGWLSAIGI